ncbi:glycosyltransferase [Lithospermum erythrorhizon]|uniref:Glycosyltransferase n=1 Tax=Lithospermum erythrorhizon TaxID=34254 RepID=A0AAV3QQA5_LITER
MGISRLLDQQQCPDRADTQTLNSDQMTVIINGYSENRIPVLQSIAATYSVSDSVALVAILWCNPTTNSQILLHLSQNVSTHSASIGSAPIIFVQSQSSSLNARFFPWDFIQTRGVLICDDDIHPDLNSIAFSFHVWKENPDKISGLFARSHAYDLAHKSWIYTMESRKYSIVLTKFMILKLDYLFKYSCGGGQEYVRLREIVDERNNCEDILMNVMVADEINRGPVLVAAEKGVRDFGDARNEGNDNSARVVEESGGVRAVGLSSRNGDHRKRRGDCISEFHMILGKMPLRYSYGKVADSIGEQGLCLKNGKLVFCDQQISV